MIWGYLVTDPFTADEKESYELKLEQILRELKDIKDGQQVIYNDLDQEFQDLKNWFILGKKNWKELYLGKLSNMVVSGIIGEAVASPLVNSFTKGFHLK